MIFLFGSTGKIGRILLPYLEGKTKIITKKEYHLKETDISIILSIYNKNIINTILFLFKLSKLINNNERIIIYELCSISQLSNIPNLLSYPKIIPYFIIRSLQSVFCTLMLSSKKVKSYKRLFIGKAISKVQKSNLAQLEINIESMGEYIYKDIFLLRKNINHRNRTKNDLILISNLSRDTDISSTNKEYKFIKAVFNLQKNKRINRIILD